MKIWIVVPQHPEEPVEVVDLFILERLRLNCMTLRLPEISSVRASAGS